MSNHYNTLGVDRNATADDIKSKYRSLAMKHHPDRGGDQAKFQEIQAAYDVLGDAQKRAEYDNPQPQMGGFHFGQNGVPHGFEDIFSQFSGFGDMFGQRSRSQRNKNLNIQTSITLEDAFYGKELMASLTLPSGREQTIEIKIPAGINDGTALRLTGLGDDSISGIARGDIHLTVHVQPHAVFQRQGDDLIRLLKINCVDAMLGKTVTVGTIDGKNIEINVIAGIQPGQVLSVPGYGMPSVSDNRFKGRMLVQIEISIPTNLTTQQKDLLAKEFN